MDSNHVDALCKRAKRLLLAGKSKEAIHDIREIIILLREVGELERADLIELTLNQYLDEEIGVEVMVNISANEIDSN
jgi:hypothetical protein